MVINGLESDNARVTEGDLLLRYGFREFTNHTLVGAGKQVATVPVALGATSQVGVAAPADLVVTLPAGNNTDVSYLLRYQGPLLAPVKEGDRVAELVIRFADSQQIVPLVATEDVAALSGFAKGLAVLKHWLGIS